MLCLLRLAGSCRGSYAARACSDGSSITSVRRVARAARRSAVAPELNAAPEIGPGAGEVSNRPLGMWSYYRHRGVAKATWRPFSLYSASASNHTGRGLNSNRHKTARDIGVHQGQSNRHRTASPAGRGCKSPMAAARRLPMFSDARRSGSASRWAYRAVVDDCVCPSNLPIIGRPRPRPAPTLA